MNKEYYVMEERHGTQCFCPIEFDKDGTFEIILGMNLLFSLNDMKKRAKKIWRVDSVETLKNPQLIYESV